MELLPALTPKLQSWTSGCLNGVELDQHPHECQLELGVGSDKPMFLLPRGGS